MKKLFLLFVVMAMLSVSACSGKRPVTMNNSGNSGESTEPSNMSYQTNIKQVDKGLSDYFLPAGTEANFKGEGNQYADLEIDVAKPYEDYVITYEYNGGVMARYIYQIGKDQITTISYDTVDTHEDFPTLAEIKAMNPVGVYLQKPFEVGTTFGQWKIVETGVQVETPYKTFDNAFVIESSGADHLLRKFFVEGYGEVKRESVMRAADGTEYTVTSSLQSVSTP